MYYYIILLKSNQRAGNGPVGTDEKDDLGKHTRSGGIAAGGASPGEQGG